MVRKYFGTDGIRGRANGVITPELALKVGQAAGLTFRRGEHRHGPSRKQRRRARRNETPHGIDSVAFLHGRDNRRTNERPAQNINPAMKVT